MEHMMPLHNRCLLLHCDAEQKKDTIKIKTQIELYRKSFKALFKRPAIHVLNLIISIRHMSSSTYESKEFGKI